LPKVTENIERMLGMAGVSGVALSSSLVPAAGTFQGGCGFVCRHMGDRSDPMEPLRREIRSGFESMSQERIAAAVREQDREEAIEEMAEGADRFLAGLQMKLTEKERELFFALIARRQSGGEIRFLSFTEIGVQMGITRQAARKRWLELSKNNPSVGHYVRAIRNPEKPRNFSELSPSQRRQAGVDESYGYEAEG